jgi:1-acyl-sn-glycerol-3-phosphate acyltransferase
MCAAMIGTREVQSIGQVMPRVFMPVGIRFSRPLCFERSSDGADSEDPMALRRITDEIMFFLRELSGQEYVNRYAKRHDVLEGPTQSPTGPPRVSGQPAPHDRQRAVAVASG